MQNRKPFSKSLLVIGDVEKKANELADNIRLNISGELRRKGAVIGLSGGIDSSVVAGLAVKAMGPRKVLGVMMPEMDSSSESKDFAMKLAGKLGIDTLEENISSSLEGFGCYRRRNEAVKMIFPEFDPLQYKMKIGINKSGLDQNLPPLFSLTIVDPEGKEYKKLLSVKSYLQIVAASNFKQRSRMAMLYYHAERLHYAVTGTANKHETEQGFFVKYGDSGVDLMPIGQLYKSQVYQLARFLKVPEEIINRTPTSDTYSAEQTQEEFFFQLPFELMDRLWYGYENDYSPAEVGAELEMEEEAVRKIYRNFARKQETTRYLRMNVLK